MGIYRDLGIFSDIFTHWSIFWHFHRKLHNILKNPDIFTARIIGLRTVWGLGRSKLSADNGQVGNFSKVKDKVKNHSYKETLLETFCSFPMGQLKGSGLLRTFSSSPSRFFESLAPIWDKNQESQDRNKDFENPGRRGRRPSCGDLERIQSKRGFIRFGFWIDCSVCQNTTRNGLCFSCWCSTTIWTLYRTR